MVEQLGVSRATLARYQELYKFPVEFPRFFRVNISYTAILKYAKPIKTNLKLNKIVRPVRCGRTYAVTETGLWS